MKSYTEVLAFRKQAALSPQKKRELYEQRRMEGIKGEGMKMLTAPFNALLGSGSVVKAKSLFDRGTGAVGSAASGVKDLYNTGRQAINTQMQRVGEGAVNKLYGNAVSAAAAKPAEKGEEALYNQAQNWSLIGQGLTGANKVIGADKSGQNASAQSEGAEAVRTARVANANPPDDVGTEGTNAYNMQQNKDAYNQRMSQAEVSPDSESVDVPAAAATAPQYGNIDWGKTALPGLAMGGGAALIAALLSGKKNKGRNALMAALIGGGIGVGGSALWQRYGQPKSASVKQAGLKEWWAKNSPATHMKNIHNAGVDFKSDMYDTAGALVNKGMDNYMVDHILPELPGIEPITPMVAGAIGGGTSAILAALLSKKNKGRNAILAGTAGALGGAGIAAGTQGVDKIRGIWMLAKDKVRRRKEVKDAVAGIQAGKI